MLASSILLLTLGFPDADRPIPSKSAQLAARIDQHLSRMWKQAGVTPAPRAEDSTFVRRVYLDLLGRIPTVHEVRAFAENRAADRRQQLIERLVASPTHFRHRARAWRREWIPQADAPGFASMADETEAWLATRLSEGDTYDRIVRSLLTARVERSHLSGQLAFLRASEFTAENLAANSSRAFLGINLDCAQCHDHPFARWTRDQFWQTAAFFVRPKDVDKDIVEIEIPNTSRRVGPRLLDAGTVTWPKPIGPDSGRMVLTSWVVAKTNPFFAKNAVNRLWASLFGAGLVEPLDSLGDDPTSHPKLLNDLAKEFAESGFDLQHLTTALVLTRAYQLSSVGAKGEGDEARLFARSSVRLLNGEQLYDSLRVASGFSAVRTDLDPLQALQGRQHFADRFRVERGDSAGRSILQSLTLMNGKLTQERTAPSAPTLRAIADAPFLDTQSKVETLYLATLARKPTEAESKRLVEYVDRGGAERDASKALADVLWAILNSSEFNTNH